MLFAWFFLVTSKCDVIYRNMFEFSSIFAWAPAVAFLPICIISYSNVSNKKVAMGLQYVATLISVSWFTYLLTNHWQDSFSSTVYATVAASSLIYIVLSWVIREFNKLISLFAPSMLYLSILSAFWFNSESSIDYINQSISSWLVLHIAMAVLTYALLTLSAIAALAVVYKEFILKSRRKSKLSDQLPSVIDANQIQFLLMLLAETLLFIGLLSGMAANFMGSGHVLDFDHKTVLTMIAFVVIAVLLFMHCKMGLRGRRAATWILLAYLIVTLGYPGVKFISEVLINS